jgi:ribonuclease HI
VKENYAGSCCGEEGKFGGIGEVLREQSEEGILVGGRGSDCTYLS